MLTYGHSPLAEQVPSVWRGKIVHAGLTIGDTMLTGADALPDRRPDCSALVECAELHRRRSAFRPTIATGRSHPIEVQCVLIV